jgi:transcriptional regulator with XRE-family HTH domain
MEKTIYSLERKQLSTKLIAAREEANLTQRQVEQSLGLSQSELSKIENGQRKVEFLVLLKLAKFYNQSINYFIPDSF